MNIDEIIARLHELEEENSMLKSLLSKHGIAYEKVQPEIVVLAQESEKQNSAMHSLSLQEKVDLFRSLFKGREDVFAKRWYSDTSKKSGVCFLVLNFSRRVKKYAWFPTCLCLLQGAVGDFHCINYFLVTRNLGSDVGLAFFLCPFSLRHCCK